MDCQKSADRSARPAETALSFAQRQAWVTDRLADLCEIEPDRLRTWVFARWCVEAAWAQPHEVAPMGSVISAVAPS